MMYVNVYPHIFKDIDKQWKCIVDKQNGARFQWNIVLNNDSDSNTLYFC
mgnify:FL=1